jgi:hypothetical protein
VRGDHLVERAALSVEELDQGLAVGVGIGDRVVEPGGDDRVPVRR